MTELLKEIKNENMIDYFIGDTFGMNQFKCIEIEASMIDDLKNGQLEIRGNSNDETILVSATKSYKLRQHDNSNTMLLTSFNHKDDDFFVEKTIDYNADNNNHNDNKKEKAAKDKAKKEADAKFMNDFVEFHNDDNDNELVFGAMSCIYCLSHYPPRLDTLIKILYERPYKGISTPEPSISLDDDLSFEGLKLISQCSDAELLNALNEINAIKVNNEWRVIDEEYLYSCFQEILYCIMEQKIGFDKIRCSDIIQYIDEYNEDIVNHCLKIYSVDDNKIDNNGYYILDHNKISIFYAKQILMNENDDNNNNGKMNHSEFLNKWKDILPYGIKQPNESILTGHIVQIYDKITNSNVWCIFEEKKLSPEPKTRFKQLFEMKDKWSMEEITPYLNTLIKSGHNVDKLLLRHTKMIRIRENNVEKRLYTSRQTKRR